MHDRVRQRLVVVHTAAHRALVEPPWRFEPAHARCNLYRSAIVYTNDEQQCVALEPIAIVEATGRVAGQGGYRSHSGPPDPTIRPQASKLPGAPAQWLRIPRSVLKREAGAQDGGKPPTTPLGLRIVCSADVGCSAIVCIRPDGVRQRHGARATSLMTGASFRESPPLMFTIYRPGAAARPTVQSRKEMSKP